MIGILHHNEQMPCLLCQSEAREFEADYLHCPNCDLRFLNPARHLGREEESARYDLHLNHSEDPAYQRFVSPAVELIKARISPPTLGLDFGCGADSAVIRLLRDANYEINAYDPLYFPNENVLQKKYGFIVATEVLEHLHRPVEVLQRLKDMLEPDGALVLMTHIYSEKINFSTWYYRRDPTHVAFYSAKTFKWIEKRFAFQSLEIHGDRTIWLQAR